MGAKNPINSDNPDGNFLYGLGDAYGQAALIYTFNARCAAGFGDRLIVPTGTNGVGNGKWQIMPDSRLPGEVPEIGPDIPTLLSMLRDCPTLLSRPLGPVFQTLPSTSRMR
jgi:hypothetical protein